MGQDHLSGSFYCPLEADSLAKSLPAPLKIRKGFNRNIVDRGHR